MYDTEESVIRELVEGQARLGPRSMLEVEANFYSDRAQVTAKKVQHPALKY